MRWAARTLYIKRLEKPILPEVVHGLTAGFTNDNLLGGDWPTPDCASVPPKMRRVSKG